MIVDDLKDRITAAVDGEILVRTWREIDYRLDIIRATNGSPLTKTINF